MWQMSNQDPDNQTFTLPLINNFEIEITLLNQPNENGAIWLINAFPFYSYQWGLQHFRRDQIDNVKQESICLLTKVNNLLNAQICMEVIKLKEKRPAHLVPKAHVKTPQEIKVEQLKRIEIKKQIHDLLSKTKSKRFPNH